MSCPPPHVSRARPLPSYNHRFLAMPKPEAFSRVLIDQELRESGWDLLDERRVRFELDSHSGRADYVLSGERGPLCVLEAKRPDLDPYDPKEQARGYAENLRAPFVILSNGKEHWFWNYERTGHKARCSCLCRGRGPSRALFAGDFLGTGEDAFGQALASPLSEW